jgi:hypothetical protein
MILGHDHCDRVHLTVKVNATHIQNVWLCHAMNAEKSPQRQCKILGFANAASRCHFGLA